MPVGIYSTKKPKLKVPDTPRGRAIRQLEEEYISRGMPPAEAERAAEKDEETISRIRPPRRRWKYPR